MGWEPRIAAKEGLDPIMGQWYRSRAFVYRKGIKTEICTAKYGAVVRHILFAPDTRDSKGMTRI